MIGCVEGKCVSHVAGGAVVVWMCSLLLLTGALCECRVFMLCVCLCIGYIHFLRECHAQCGVSVCYVVGYLHVPRHFEYAFTLSLLAI